MRRSNLCMLISILRGCETLNLLTPKLVELHRIFFVVSDVNLSRMFGKSCSKAFRECPLGKKAKIGRILSESPARHYVMDDASENVRTCKVNVKSRCTGCLQSVDYPFRLGLRVKFRVHFLFGKLIADRHSSKVV